jgi:3alpha(or 20beta)-hydroxysteroid dehydrogenase
MTAFDLTGRVALITGGAQGLGAGIADAFARAGAAVMIGDIREEAGQQSIQAVAKHGGETGFARMDITSETDWEAATARCVAELGGFDILVNNAGIEVSELIIDTDPENLRRMLEVNVLGTALGIKHAFRAMRPGGSAGHGGVIVNISSVAATIAFPGISGYSATKSGVDRLTRVAALESGKLGYGVRVNCLYPGLVPTEMGTRLATDMVELGLWPSAEEAVGDVIGLTPFGRLGEVADMADAAVFLACDASRFVHGHGLAVDGGMGM